MQQLRNCSHQKIKRYYGLLLLLTACIIIIAVFSFGPIPQDPKYHNFADNRIMWGIPNCLNVISNIPFLISGLYA